MWKCPGCGSDNLDVLVTVWARLDQWKDMNGEGSFGTDADSGHDGSHEWDEESQMYCRECMKQDKAGKFETGGKED